MATIDTVRSSNLAILRTPISDAQATSIAAQIDAGALTIAQFNSSLILQARTSSIPALLIDQQFTGSINSTADIDGFTRQYTSALTQAQANAPGTSFAVAQLNAFQAIGADLAGNATFNQNFQAQYGTFVGAANASTSANDIQFINAAYQNTFGIQPAGTVIAQYTAALTALRAQYGSDLKAKGALLGQIVGEAVVNAPTSTITTSAANTLSSLASGGTFQAGPLGTNIVGGGVGSSVLLTTDIDTKSGTAFEAPLEITQSGATVQTLGASDNLTGNGKGATLNATLNSNTSVNPILNGIETVNLRTNTTSNLDLGRATGILTIAHDATVAGADLTVTNIKSITGVAVSNAAPGGTTDTLFQFQPAALAGATDTVKVALTNNGAATSASGTVNIAGLGVGVAETLDVTVSGVNRLVSLGSDATAAVGAVIGATNGATTYKFSGGGSVRVDTALLNATTVDGSGLTGAMRVSVDAAKDVTVTGGKGADNVTFGAGLTNADKYDGGDLRDTLSVSAGTGLSDGNGIKNVEILSVTGAAAFTFDNDKVTSIDAFVHNTTGAMVYQNVVGANAADVTKGLTITNTGAVDFQIKGAAALGANSDTVSVVIGSTSGAVATADNTVLQTAAGAATGALTFSNIEVLNFDVKADAANQTSTGTGAITAAAATTVTLKGGFAGEAFALSAGGAFGGQPLTSIDASTFTGNLTVSGNAFSQVIKAGSGNDVILTGGRAAFADATASDVLTGGAGQDQFQFATSDAALTGANLTTAAASIADGVSEITAISDLNLGGSTAGSFVDRIDLSVVGGANTAGTLGLNANVVTIANGGAVTAMTGTNLGTAVNAVVNGGVLAGPNAAGTVTAGLFSFGGETYLIASEGSVNNDNFGAVASADIIIRVTGVTGTLSVDDFAAF